MFVCDGGCLQVYKDLQFLVEILFNLGGVLFILSGNMFNIQD